MSDAPEDANLVAGHAPAVKVGNMRVAQHKQTKEKPAEAKQTEEEKEEFPSPPKPDLHHQQLLLSGAVTKGDKDFTTEAVKSFHDKPQPTHDNRNVQHHSQKVIQQPRKQ